MTTPQAPFAVVLDIETEGLDPANHQILEVAAIAVDKNWRELAGASRFEMVVRRENWPLSVTGMQVERNVDEMHTKNDLWKATNEAVDTENSVGWALRNWLQAQYLITHEASTNVLRPVSGVAVLAGNGIDFDIGSLKARMPMAAEMLHYRKIDLRSLFLFAENAGIGFEPTPKDKYTHRAMGDCEIELADARRLHQQLVGADAIVRAHGARVASSANRFGG